MRIYIDVGHGGVDPTGADTGTHGVYNGVNYKENEVNLKIAMAARQALWDLGHTVMLSRSTNVNFGGLVPKADGTYFGRNDSNTIRSAEACKTGQYDVMVSIHNNSYDKATARGYVLIYKTGNGKEAASNKLSDYLSLALTKVLPANDIRTKKNKDGTDWYGILRLQDKPGVLIECAFMSNQQDMAILSDDGYINMLGEAIANGIHKYSGEKAPEKKTETKVEETKEAAVTVDEDLNNEEYKLLYEDLRGKYDKVVEVCNSALDKVNDLDKELKEVKAAKDILLKELSESVSINELLNFINSKTK